MASLQELRDAMLHWFAQASGLSTHEVLPAYRWLCEARGCCYEEPTVECLSGVLDSMRAMALEGGTSRQLVDSHFSPFRHVLAGF